MPEQGVEKTGGGVLVARKPQRLHHIRCGLPGRAFLNTLLSFWESICCARRHNFVHVECFNGLLDR